MQDHQFYQDRLVHLIQSAELSTRMWFQWLTMTRLLHFCGSPTSLKFYKSVNQILPGIIHSGRRSSSSGQRERLAWCVYPVMQTLSCYSACSKRRSCHTCRHMPYFIPVIASPQEVRQCPHPRTLQVLSVPMPELQLLTKEILKPS